MTKWVPVSNIKRVHYNAPLANGGFKKSKDIALKISEGKTTLALTLKKSGNIHVISKGLVTKIETAEQSIPNGKIRWVSEEAKIIAAQAANHTKH